MRHGAEEGDPIREGRRRKEEGGGRTEGGRSERSVLGPKGPKSHGSVHPSSASFIFEERQCTHPIKTDSFKVLKDWTATQSSRANGDRKVSNATERRTEKATQRPRRLAVFGEMATTQVGHAHRDRDVSHAPRSVAPQRCVHGVPNLMGVLSNVLGVSSPREPLSADNSLRRRFGVQECSITSGSCWKADVAVKQYCVN